MGVVGAGMMVLLKNIIFVGKTGMIGIGEQLGKGRRKSLRNTVQKNRHANIH